MDKLDILQKEIKLLHEYCDSLKTLINLHEDLLKLHEDEILALELRISKLEDDYVKTI